MNESDVAVKAPAESARDEAIKSKEIARGKEEESIRKEAAELYDTARISIDGMAKKGEFDTMLCLRYEGYREDRNSKMKVAKIVKDRLMSDGFGVRRSENTAIKEILLCIDWR
jgi:hypothetical protein